MTAPFDDNTLDDIRDLYSALDPMPAELVRLARFALEVDLLGVDVAAPDVEVALAGAGARGGPQDRLITFTGTAMTITLHIRPLDDDVRIDGWLVPAVEHQVKLRTEHGITTVRSSPHGRFVFDRASRGAAQLIVHRPMSTGTTVTPTIDL